MSYYIGFRFGWVRLGKRMVAWHDATLYPWYGHARLGCWKVWVK